MAKSQFLPIEKAQGKRVRVSGTTAEPPELNVVEAQPLPYVHAMLVQDGRVVFAEAGPANNPLHPTTWELEGDADGLDEGKPIQAFGLSVQFLSVDDGAAFETFAWSQEIKFKTN